MKRIAILSFVLIIDNPAFSVVYFEKEGLAVTAEMLTFRKKWVGSALAQ